MVSPAHRMSAVAFAGRTRRLEAQHWHIVRDFKQLDPLRTGVLALLVGQQAGACVQDTSFNLDVHPDSLVISAGLGNVTAVDASLDESNPYRKACQPRQGSSTSLIKAAPPPPHPTHARARTHARLASPRLACSP